MKRSSIVIPAVLAACCAPVAASAAENAAMAALARDAQRFAECVESLQADCVFELTHVESFAAAGVQTPYIDLEELRELWQASPPADEATSQSGLNEFEQPSEERMMSFAALEPQEPFSTGNRLFAFVPFRQTNVRPTGWLERTGFLVGISEDDGASWRFNIINGYHLLPFHVVQIYPELAGRTLPPIENELRPWPAPVTSRFLRTADGRFSFVEGAAWYSMRFEVRRRLRDDLDLVVTFDNPAEPGRLATMGATLDRDQENLEVRSLPFSGFEPGRYYDVVVSGFAQGTGEELFRHRQSLLFNPTKGQVELLTRAPAP